MRCSAAVLCLLVAGTHTRSFQTSAFTLPLSQSPQSRDGYQRFTSCTRVARQTRSSSLRESSDGTRGGAYEDTNGGSDATATASVMLNPNDQNTQAGKDGYSVMRQPLSKGGWDPDVDPDFEAPSSLSDSNNAKADSSWWSGKQQQEGLQQGRARAPLYDSNPQANYNPNGRSFGVSSGLSQQGGGRMSSISSGIINIDGDDNGSDGDNEDFNDPLADEALAMNQLDLFQRSLDTLDFAFVLNALRVECFTTPARRMIDEGKQASILFGDETANGSNKSGQSKNNKGNGKSKSKSNMKDNEAFRPLTGNNVEAVQERYAAVQEMQLLLAQEVSLGDAYYKSRRGYKVKVGGGNPPPLEGLSFDLDSILEICDEGNVLEGPEILEISTIMDAVEDLELWGKGLEHVNEGEIQFVELPKIVQNIDRNETLQTLLSDAFDKNGKLSGKTFPTLGRLRATVRTLKADILQTLDSLVALPSIKSKLALESGGPLYSEISNGGRLVLPIDPKYASSIGIVHDSSRSGKTVYVEPSEVVGPTNELRQMEAELRQEEARVWRSLTEQILNNRQSLSQSVHAVGQLDLVLARTLLGDKIGGVVPTVKDEGVISLQDARHPVLLLRGLPNVVGSDIDLGKDGNQGLVLTGPNSGGKTVIMKLLGLVALMSRSGIPVPAARPRPGQEDYVPRVDYFDPILADIGDIQSVDGDLSTFSGHMLVCREVLANSGRNALVLMDELGSGTDPAQGVAIAQALLEALVDTGCRVAITTHYMELKQLAASDSRFSVAGMQFVRGRPTYKLLPGTVGESFAMAVAERLDLPGAVVTRAYDLLDTETRQMGDLIRELEDQKSVVEEQAAELEEKKKEMAAFESKMQEEQARLERKMLNARRDEAKKFAHKLEEKEKVLEDVLDKLKSDPSRKIIAKSWDNIKFVKRDALTEAENVPSVVAAKKKAAQTQANIQAELIPVAEMREKPELKVGDKLIMCKRGPLFGREAIVAKNMGRRLEVKISGMTMSVKLTEVSAFTSSKLPEISTISSSINSSYNSNKGQSMKGTRASGKAAASKAAERAIQTEGRVRDASVEVGGAVQRPKKAGVAIRTDSNTVDVRGCYFEEARDKARGKFSESIMSGRTTVFILHGHGTGGVLKAKLRAWLNSEKSMVKQWNPAEQTDGGDAFTRVELK